MEKKSIHTKTLQNVIREIRKITRTQMPLTLLSFFFLFEIFILFLKNFSFSKVNIHCCTSFKCTISNNSIITVVYSFLFLLV